jgi:hypothetical protein
MKTDYPLAFQEPLSLVVVLYSDLEAIALRIILEYFNYRVEIHWIGSRPQFLEVLKGNIPTFHYIVLSCHGDATGILVPEQESISSNTALLFAIHLFYFLSAKYTLTESFQRSCQYDDQCALFKLFLPIV